ncbi:Zn-dependent hydrolase [Candidatus Saccharibacteria bacterium]|nr:Zn-dependent hydrolase [Candidatus Saccharibacteria bacterium]
MLEIEYKGGNGIVLSTKKANLVVDPKLSAIGLKDMNVKDAVEVATEERFALKADSARLQIEGPGEYGVADFDIRGVAVQRHLDTDQDPKRGTVYRIVVNGFRIAVAGNMFGKLSEEQLEEVGIIDILIIPVGGGGYTLDSTGAVAVTRQIDPRVVIPVHYADDGLKYEVPQAPADEFIKELGVTVEEVEKYKLKQLSSIPAGLTIVKLARS